MLDDGQFGQAVVLTQFNWARGYSEGGEFKLKYKNGNFNAYGNFAYNITRAIGPESNQYVLDAATYNYLLTNWHYTDDMQLHDRLGRRIVSLVRYPVHHKPDLRQRPARRRFICMASRPIPCTPRPTP